MPHSGPFYRIFGQKSINARLFGKYHKKKRKDAEGRIKFFGKIHNLLIPRKLPGTQKRKNRGSAAFQKETIAFKPDYRYNKLIHYT